MNNEEPKTDNDPTVKEVIDTMSDYQKMAFYHCIDYIMKAKIAYKTLDENQKKVCDYMVGYVLKEETWKKTKSC